MATLRLLVPLLLLALWLGSGTLAHGGKVTKSKARVEPLWRKRYNPDRPELPRLETLYRQVNHYDERPLTALWRPGGFTL